MKSKNKQHNRLLSKLKKVKPNNPNSWSLEDWESLATTSLIACEDPVLPRATLILIEAFRRNEKALRFAAGYISGFAEWKDKHPDEVFNWLLKKGVES